MKQYFDFNSFEKSIRKSLFEGIDLDDETEDIEDDVQFEKPTSNNNDLFKQESEQMQFRKMVKELTQPLFNDTDYRLIKNVYGSYIKDDQKHYTCACVYKRFNALYLYVFDFCFESKDLLMYYLKTYTSFSVFSNDAVVMISEFSKHNDNINIYYNEIFSNDLQTESDITTQSLLNIESIYSREIKYVCVNFPIQHIFFKNFKGFTPNPIKEYPEKRMYPRVKIIPSQFENESDANTLCNMLNAVNIKANIYIKKPKN